MTNTNSTKSFGFKNWLELFLSVLVVILGLWGFADSIAFSLFWTLLGGSIFVKQVKKYQGKDESDPMVKAANVILKVLKYLIIGLILLVIISALFTAWLGKKF